LPESALHLASQVVLSMLKQTTLTISIMNNSIATHVWTKHELAIEYWPHDPVDFPATSEEQNNVPKEDNQVC
jgi:hypothetical protein